MKTSNVSAEERVEHTPSAEEIVDAAPNWGELHDSADRISAGVDRLKAEREALVSALRGLVDMYSHAWDRVDGGLMMMGGSVEKFDAAHAKAFEVLKSAGA